MVFGTGRMCNYNDFSLKSPICYYNSLLNPYESSSGIDKNPFELKENFMTGKNRYNHPKNKLYYVFLFIVVILLLYIRNKFI